MLNPILKTLADNQLLLEATKKALMDEFEFQVGLDEVNIPNEILGERARADLIGQARIELFFRKVEKLKTIPASPEKVNQAR